MKWIDCHDFDTFNMKLDGLDAGNYVIHGKIELYSCKKARSDKKLSKQLAEQYSSGTDKSLDTLFDNEKKRNNSKLIYTTHNKNQQPVLSPSSPLTTLPSSPFGPLTDPASRNTLLVLISTLNSSFPDYDFSEVKGKDFIKETKIDHVINSINLSLRDCLSTDLRSRMWMTIENVMNLSDCDIYSFAPDPDSDPMAGGNKIWSWNYFFYNKKQKKLLFFTCYAKSKKSEYSDTDSDDMFISNPKNAEVHFYPRIQSYEDMMEFDDL